MGDDDDGVERQLLELEAQSPTSAYVVVRCRGVDAQGRQCTRTRIVGRKKLYRLPESKLFCHRHSPQTTSTRKIARRRQRTRNAWHLRKAAIVAVIIALSAVGLVVAGVHFHTLWLCLLGLVVFSLASLCACAVVVATIVRALWVAPTTSHPPKNNTASGCTVNSRDGVASIA